MAGLTSQAAAQVAEISRLRATSTLTGAEAIETESLHLRVTAVAHAELVPAGDVNGGVGVEIRTRPSPSADVPDPQPVRQVSRR